MNQSSRAWFLALGIAVAATIPAAAATPTEAQQQAIRSNCVKDYRAHCSSVPTGGMDALICLQQNVDSLSPACKTAVEAVDPPASPAPSSATTAPATTTPAPAATATPPAATTPAPAATAEAPAKPAAAATATTTMAPPADEPKLTFRQELAIAGGACAVDFRLLCPNLPVGHGNVLFCLEVHGARLAPACRNALTTMGVRF